MKASIAIAVSFIFLTACRDKFTSDASGVFESDEIIVSAEQTGKILTFDIEEGEKLQRGMQVGQIDTKSDELRKEQVEASIKALGEKTNNVTPQLELTRKQLAVQQEELDHLQHEQKRIANLVKADAATQKQLDDINASVEQARKQIEVTRQQLNVTQSNVSTQNRSILSERDPLQKSAAQIQELIDRGEIINPINGTVLVKYAFQGEVATMGKPLYKIANVDTLTLRAYITGAQLSQVKLNQQVKVLIDDGKKNFKEYPGTIYWISAKAEFTPKTIQTKDERANLVYPIKIRVKNDGYIKIGMYGEVKWSEEK